MELSKRQLLVASQALGYAMMFAKTEDETAEFALLKLDVDGALIRHTTMNPDILVLLKRNFPTEYEIHRGEISGTKNLILTTTDEKFANKLVNSYNEK